MQHRCKFLLAVFTAAVALVNVRAQTGIKNPIIAGTTGEIQSGATLTNKGTLQSANGSTTDLQLGTVLLPSDVTRLGTSIDLSGAEATGTLAAGRFPALTGDISTTAGALGTTLATVNSNVGSFGSATAAPTFTVDGKGRITAAATVTITPAWGSITSKPTTISGYGITDPIVLTSGNYADPSWITSLAASKLTGTVSTARLYTTAADYNITNGANIDAWGAKTVPTGTVIGTSDTQTLTNKTISGASNTLSNIGNSSLTNSAITIAGTSTSLGGSITLDTIDNALASTGLIARTAANTRAARTITAPAAGISVSNGDGVSGNPTLALTNDLSALEGLSSTGFAVRTATDTYAQRSIAGTSPVQVANGSGVSGNPTISVDAATTSASGIVELATTAEALAGTDTARVPSVAALEARTLAGTFTRPVKDALYSDGSTSNRRAEWALGTAGAVAALPLSIPFEFDVPTSNPAATTFIVAFSPNGAGTPSVQSYALSLYVATDGALGLRQVGATLSDFRSLIYSGFRSAFSGLRVRGVVVWVSPDTTTAPVIYLQGVDVSASFSATTGGTPPNWVPSALDTTKFLCGLNFPAGRFQPHAPILGALTAAEVLEWTQTGRLPTWCEIATGSAVASVTNDGTSAGNFVNSGGNAGAAFDVNSTVVGKIYFLLQASGNSWFANTPALSAETVGKRFGFTIKARLRSGTAIPIVVGSDLASSQVTSFTPTGTETVFTGTFTNNGGILRIGVVGNANGSSYEFDDFAMWPLGPILKPVIQPGVTLRDAGANKLTGVITGGITVITSNESGSFTSTLTWSGTHEAKSLLGAQALPSSAVVTRITSKATVSSSGSGVTIGTTSSATRWVAANAFTTAKKLHTLANQLPAGTSANDLDIVVDPDTSNYTGSITVTVNYVITDGTP